MPHDLTGLFRKHAPTMTCPADDRAPLMPVMESAPAPRTVLDGREYLYFAGTGYLGLQAHPAVIAAAATAVQRFGVHSATTRTGFGNSPPVLEVEQRAAEILGAEAACYLVTGYAGNFVIAAAMRSEVDVAFIDEAAHDCLHEAVRWLDLARPAIAFRHRDVGHLVDLLRRELSRGQRPLVMTDGVFAASGRLAPLEEYLVVLQDFIGAKLLVDDAHGIGVLGTQGRGSLELANIASQQINVMNDTRNGAAVLQSVTLSKAFGGHGGAIAGSRGFLEHASRASGWFRGSSAPAAAVAGATAMALEIFQNQPGLRLTLRENIAYARGRLRQLGLSIDALPSSIISFELANAQEMQRVQRDLLATGVAIAHTRDYAGANTDGMLRIAIFATHTRPMIDQLTATLARVL